jgi:hypothetical protein
MTVKAKAKRLISLSQSEILGFGDELVSLNVTKLKKYIYYLIGNCKGMIRTIVMAFRGEFVSDVRGVRKWKFHEEISLELVLSQLRWN